MEIAKYCWKQVEIGDSTEWHLNLFPKGEKEKYYPRIIDKFKELFGKSKRVYLPFIARHKKENVAQHVLRLEEFEPKPFESKLSTFELLHYASSGEKPVNYSGEIDAEFTLTYVGWMDWEYRSGAYFSKGNFKCGRMATKGGKFTESLQEFKDDLTSYWVRQTENFGLPPFGEYLKEFLRVSNLPLETILSFRDFLE